MRLQDDNYANRSVALGTPGYDVSAYRPLYVACREGCVDVAAWLVARGARVNERDMSLRSPLCAACLCGSADVVRWLLNHGADACETCGAGGGPLHIASLFGFVEVIQALLGGGAHVNQVMRDSMLDLISRHCLVGARGGLFAAGVKAMSKHTGPGPATPLYLATCRGQVEATRMLLGAGADPDLANRCAETPLHAASQHGHVEVIQALLAAGADVNRNKQGYMTPLYVASHHGHAEVVRALLAGGAQVDKARDSHETPLYAASYQGHVEVIRALLAGGADVNGKRGQQGKIPIVAAAQRGRMEPIRALLKSRTAESARSHINALCVASRNGRVEAVRLLLRCGAVPSGALSRRQLYSGGVTLRRPPIQLQKGLWGGLVTGAAVVQANIPLSNISATVDAFLGPSGTAFLAALATNTTVRSVEVIVTSRGLISVLCGLLRCVSLATIRIALPEGADTAPKTHDPLAIIRNAVDSLAVSQVRVLLFVDDKASTELCVSAGEEAVARNRTRAARRHFASGERVRVSGDDRTWEVVLSSPSRRESVELRAVDGPEASVESEKVEKWRVVMVQAAGAMLHEVDVAWDRGLRGAWVQACRTPRVRMLLNECLDPVSCFGEERWW